MPDKLPEMQTLPEFLTKHFLDWQAKEGERKTLEEFSNFLGVNRSLLSYWMNGSRVPKNKNIDKLAVKLGNEIYDVLDLPRPNPYLQVVNRLWEFLPEDLQKQFSEEAENYETKNASKRVRKVPKRRTARNSK